MAKLFGDNQKERKSQLQNEKKQSNTEMTVIEALFLQDAQAAEDVSEPFWVPCQRNGVRCGRLLAQVQFVQDVHSRPLHILLVTWNMANMPPGSHLPACFAGANTCDLSSASFGSAFLGLCFSDQLHVCTQYSSARCWKRPCVARCLSWSACGLSTSCS
jgi:hypothetical protein